MTATSPELFPMRQAASPRLLWMAILIFAISACSGGVNSPANTDTNDATTVSAPTEAVEPTQEPAPEPTTASAAPDTIEPTQELLVVRFGVNAEFEPFVFKDEAGQIVGFDIDLINALAQIGNFELTYTDLPFEELLTRVESGELDAAISAITVTEERSLRVNFSDAYFRSGQAPVSYYNPGQGLAVQLDETDIVGAESLTVEVRVGVKSETTGAAFVADNTTAQAVAFPEAGDALQALREGTVDAVVIDIPVIVRYIGNNPDAGIRITGGPLTDELYAVAVNPARADVLERINAALAKIQAEGLYKQIFEKWFGSP